MKRSVAIRQILGLLAIAVVASAGLCLFDAGIDHGASVEPCLFPMTVADTQRLVVLPSKAEGVVPDRALPEGSMALAPGAPPPKA